MALEGRLELKMESEERWPILSRTGFLFFQLTDGLNTGFLINESIEQELCMV